MAVKFQFIATINTYVGFCSTVRIVLYIVFFYFSINIKVCYMIVQGASPVQHLVPHTIIRRRRLLLACFIPAKSFVISSVIPLSLDVVLSFSFCLSE